MGQDATMIFVEDISQRKRAEEALRLRESELSSESQKLEETNTTLKVPLRHRDEDKRALETSILTNVGEIVFPFIEKLRKNRLTDNQQVYLNIIKSGLNEVLSSFVQEMMDVYSHFTPTEIRVANLAKSGKTTKEIAELLSVGTATVDSHCNGLITKLGCETARRTFKCISFLCRNPAELLSSNMDTNSILGPHNLNTPKKLTSSF
jgi:DNA-binding CsgD family transcriptional regulator